MKFNVFMAGRDIPIKVEAENVEEIFSSGASESGDYYIKVDSILAIIPYNPWTDEERQAVEGLKSLDSILSILKEE